jgi:S-adenosylmethionine:tRNA ribosyltransferase-isomerase
MNTSAFDYVLPPDRIAQEPVKPRDRSRLLVLDRKTGAIAHRRFFEIGEFLRPGDLLVVNDSRVFKARLKTIEGIEIFLLRPDGSCWIALAKPGRKLSVGATIAFPNGRTARVAGKRDDGTVMIDFGTSADDVFALADAIGEVPTPPYVDKPPADAATTYQTVYAEHVGSVAAPTAGFHFTPELIDELKSDGIRFATVTLHVGLGTFRPIKTDTLESHEMHEEWIRIPEQTRRLVEETKRNGGRVIAVGTTTVRALESGIDEGFTKLFITPGYRFKTVDAMVTNFHLPKSTLLVLVSAFAGRDVIRRAYDEAIRVGYRFYSFGDAMLIL